MFMGGKLSTSFCRLSIASDLMNSKAMSQFFKDSILRTQEEKL